MLENFKIIISQLVVVAASFLICMNVEAATFSSHINYSAKSGLSNNSVNSVVQDQEGYIWIATKEGLDRFDGTSFKHYSIGGLASVLYLDYDGTLWIGSENGLFSYDKTSDSIQQHKIRTEWNVQISSRVTAIVGEDNIDSKLYIATLGQGLFILNKKHNKLTQHSLHASILKSISLTPKTILVGGEESTITELSKSGNYVKNVYLDSLSSTIRDASVSLLIQAFGNILVNIENKGLYNVFDKYHQKPFVDSENGNTLNVKCSISLGPDEIYVGTENGLYSIDFISNSLRKVLDNNGRHILAGYDINSICKDYEGGLWFATQRSGLFYFSGTKKHFNHIKLSNNEDEFDGNISAFCHGKNGTIWIGTERGRIYHTDTFKKKHTLTNIRVSSVKSLMLDEGNLWIGTATDGLYVVDINSGKSRNFRHDRYSSNTLSDNCINVIYKTSRGQIMIGTKWGLDYYDEQSNSFTHEIKCTNKADISCIIEDSKRNVWITTHNMGIMRMDIFRNNWRRIGYARPDSKGDITDIIEDFSGNIWFATSTGLRCFDYSVNKLVNPQFTNSDTIGQLLSLEQDINGNIWAAGQDALFCYNLKDNSVDNVYTSKEDLNGVQFLEMCSIKDNLGYICFGGINGYNYFAPQEFSENLTHSQVIISSITLNNNPIAKKNNNQDYIAIARLNNTLKIDYSLLSYQSPKKNKYVCMLEGYDKLASPSSNQTSVSYRNIKPGRYTFKVIGYNNDGIESSNIATISIRIRRPLLASIPAFIVYSIFLGILVVMILRNYNQIKNKREIEDKLDFLTKINHEIYTPLTLIKTPLEKIIASEDGTEQTRKFLQLIDRNVGNLIELVNQSLFYRKSDEYGFTLNPKPANIIDVVEDAISRFKYQIENDGKTIIYKHPSESPLYNIDEQIINRIFGNLLSNAIKYANKEIVAELTCEKDVFILNVHNDGPPVVESEREAIFKMFYQSENSKVGTGIGLALARKLAQKHNGSLLNIYSESGASFELRVNATSYDSATIREINSKESDKMADNDKPNILVVDDNPELCTMISELLKDDYVVHQAGDPKQAFSILSNVPIDLIISDIVMDEMNGLDFCKTVKADKRYINIPFILLTAKNSMEDKLTGLNSGADDYISKPFSSDYLTSRIRNFLSGREKLIEFYTNLPIIHPQKVSTLTKESLHFLETLNENIVLDMENGVVNVDSLADKMCLSTSSFYRKVKSISGLSPVDYIKQIRLQTAATLLSKGEYTIADVCKLTGFKNPSYFTQCFRKQFGETPGQYLNSVVGARKK